MYIRDIRFAETFWDGWQRAPDEVKNQLTRRINLIAEHRDLPKSLQAHRVANIEALKDMWIGYVDLGRFSHRILFSVNDGIMTVCYLFNHEQMDRWLRRVNS